jgi:hypothetical protein
MLVTGPVTRFHAEVLIWDGPTGCHMVDSDWLCAAALCARTMAA